MTERCTACVPCIRTGHAWCPCDCHTIPDGPPLMYGRDYSFAGRDRTAKVDNVVAITVAGDDHTVVDVDREESHNPDAIDDWIRHGDDGSER